MTLVPEPRPHLGHLCGGLGVATGKKSLRVLWQISRGHRTMLLVAAVLGILSAIAGLIAPAVIGQVVDQVQEGAGELSTILWAAGLMIIAVIVGAVGTAATVVLAARAYHAMLARLRETLIEQSMLLPQRVIEQAGTGDLVSRSSDDVAQIADAAPQIIPAFTATGFTIAVTLIGLTALDPWYGVALLVLLPVYIITLRWYLRAAPPIYRQERITMSARAQELVESQRAYDTILAYGIGEQHHQRVLTASWNVVTHTLRARTVQNMFFGRLNLAEYLGLAAILGVGFFTISTGHSTIGAATTAMLLFLRLFGPINQILFVIDILQAAAASLGRIVGVITMPAAYASSTGSGEDALLAEHAVRLDGVSFGYDEHRPVLSSIDLRIPRGSLVAIVGASGAGKTTLAAIIAGIHEPDTGIVLRSGHVAVISQEIHIFQGTLRDNLTLSASGASDEDLYAALTTTHATSLLHLLPEGLDTRLGTGGYELTGAQAQQIALARLVLADPSIAILDEATAEADSADAGLLDRAAAAALHGRTALVIAHRLSQAAVCERILVMDGGSIIEDGTHEVLVSQGGLYARLWENWVS